jgi:aryl-alcohol dehydrogenase-like predicted oxidoreductase
LLVHNPGSLLGSKAQELASSLESLKASGIVSKIGVSIYDPYVLNDIASVMDLDLVQAPLNVIDRRLITSGWLKKLARMGVEIHTRSSFLQGLLLLPRDKIPSRFEAWSSLWDFWHYELEKKGLDPITECLRYVLSVSEVDRVVVGVETATQFNEIIGLAAGASSLTDWSSMVCDDERLINPSNWELL